MDKTGLRPKQDITSDLKSSRINRHSLQLRSLIGHIKQNINPFAKDCNKNVLYNISTGQGASDAIEFFLLNVDKLVNEQREQFLTELSGKFGRYSKIFI